MAEKNMLRAVVIGAGGIGSWLTEGLVRQMAFSRFRGNCALVLVDGDDYEPSNRARQGFTQMGNKANVKAEELAPMFPEVFVVPVPRWIVESYPEDYDASSEEAEYTTCADLLQDGDVVFCVVDNHATRKIVFEAAKAFDNIDCYTGGNDDAFEGSIYHYRRRDGVEVTEHPFEFHPELINPPDRNPALLSCGERAALGGSTQLIATNMAVAAWLLGRFQRDIIANKADTNAEVFFDLAAGAATSYDRAPEEVPVPSPS